MTRNPRKKTGKKKSPRESALDLPRLPFYEILAVVFGTAGIFLGLAVISYNPSDPSWNSGGDIGPAYNWMGPFGAFVSEALVIPLGIAALFVPLVLVLSAWTLLRNRLPGWPLIRVLASIAFTVFSCILFALYPGSFLLRGDSVLAGGLLGTALEKSLEAHFAKGGTWILTLAGIVLSLQVMLAIRIGPPLVRLADLLKKTGVGAVRAVAGAIVGATRASGRAVAAGVLAVGRGIRSGVASSPRVARPSSFDGMQESSPAAGGGGRARANAVRSRAAGRGRGDPGGQAGDPGRTKGDDPREQAEHFGVEEGIPRVGLDSEGDIVGPGAEGRPDVSPPHRKASRAGGAARQRQKSAGKAPRIVKSRYMEDLPSASSIVVPPEESKGEYEFPSTSFLTPPQRTEEALTESELLESARTLEAKLRDYGVDGRVVEIHPGPVITMYEYAPAPGVKVSKITNLSNDLALALRALAVRIVAPLPGKAAVGIEVPNQARQMVYLREIVEHDEFTKGNQILPLAIGKDIEGKPYATDLARMPHLLVAGATGTGKSVAVNSMLMSLLFSRTPEEVRIILIDPKIIEFSVYEDIPHLLMPVVTDPQKAARALGWAVNEMTRRYKLLTSEGARNIASYNAVVERQRQRWNPGADPGGDEPPEKLPYIIIVIDELADLMMVAGKEVQDAVVRLAQMARAAGIHMIVATQRPSVDVITGLIKANFPARVAFKVSSKTDSRTIIDANGAECLLGNGDMLFVPPGTASLVRLHGAFVSDEETRRVIEHLREQGQPQFEESLLNQTEDVSDQEDGEADEDYDEKYEEAKLVVLEAGMASISTIQRRLKIGYNRSARMVERMAKEGLIGPPTQGGKPREIYASKIQASLR